ncbi:MAG: tetratricopeptide repeat protein [Candidatus Nitrosothermus koennekii]|nr:MAG: tetratricopeptide repeat protein [Candidatus Nitrosothermus koennekii]
MRGLFKKRKDDEKKPSVNESLSHRDLSKINLFKKGINQMASENLDAAIKSFDLALRFDPNFVDALIKKGYCHFLKEEFNVAHLCYDKALDIDPNNAEAWNLKGLAYYAEKNYEKALECVEKAIDIDPNNGMAWYNRACYLSLLNRTEDALSALKRAIEIDIDYAKKAVRDRDFENVRGEIMFKRVIEVVILEALRRGYDSVGKMVWITGLDRRVIEEALQTLQMKGLVLKTESSTFGFNKEEKYELIKELAEKLSIERAPRAKQTPEPVKRLKELTEHVAKTKSIVEKGDIEQSIKYITKLLDPKEFGSILLENLPEAHRDLRIYNIRIKDKGDSYFNANKGNLIELLNDIEKQINEKIRKMPIT